MPSQELTLQQRFSPFPQILVGPGPDDDVILNETMVMHPLSKPASETPTAAIPESYVRRPLSDNVPEIPPSGHPVLELIRARQISRSKPGERADGATLVLVIEGGGMRGTISGGMVVALEQLGLSDAFDRIYGTSAGAFNAVYFIARQATYGSTIYVDDLNDRRFVDLRRLFSSEPVISLDYAIDEVMGRQKAVDWKAVLDSAIELHPVVTSLTAWRAIDLGPPRDLEHLRKALRASAQLLLLGGQPVEIDGQKCVDANFFSPIPIEIASQQGATHVLALLTRPGGVPRKGLSILDRTILQNRLKKVDPRLPERNRLRIQEYRDVVARLEAATLDPTAGPIPMFAVQPQGQEVGQLERDADKLRAAAIGGMLAVFRIAKIEPEIVETLDPYV